MIGGTASQLAVQHPPEAGDGAELRLDRGFEPPPLPDVLAHVLEVLSGPLPSLPALVARDAALAGDVLRVANSPAYQPMTPIVSLAHAEARLGDRTFAEIAAAAALRRAFFCAPGFEELLAAAWRRAVACGAFAKEIARAARLPDPKPLRAFVAALMHDLAGPLALRAALDHASVVGLSPRTPDGRAVVLLAAEPLAREAGLLPLRAWRLPSDVAAAFPDAQPAPGGEDGAVAAVVTLAGELARIACDEADASTADDACAHPAAERLQLGAGDVQALVAAVDRVRRLVDACA
jgi:HD-like signal output (HDOD) protein